MIFLKISLSTWNDIRVGCDIVGNQSLPITWHCLVISPSRARTLP